MLRENIRDEMLKKKEETRGGMLKDKERIRGGASMILHTLTSTNTKTYPLMYSRGYSKKIGGGRLRYPAHSKIYPRLKNRGGCILKAEVGLEGLVGRTEGIEQRIKQGKLHRDRVRICTLEAQKQTLLGVSILYILPFIGRDKGQEHVGEEKEDKGFVSYLLPDKYIEIERTNHSNCITNVINSLSTRSITLPTMDMYRGEGHRVIGKKKNNYKPNIRIENGIE